MAGLSWSLHPFAGTTQDLGQIGTGSDLAHIRGCGREGGCVCPGDFTAILCMTAVWTSCTHEVPSMLPSCHVPPPGGRVASGTCTCRCRHQSLDYDQCMHACAVRITCSDRHHFDMMQPCLHVAVHPTGAASQRGSLSMCHDCLCMEKVLWW